MTTTVQHEAMDGQLMSRVFLRGWRVIVAVAFALVALVLILDLWIRDRLYQSDVQVLVTDPTAQVVAARTYSSTDRERSISNELELARSRSVRQVVEAQFGPNPDVLIGHVDGRDVLTITATTKDADRSAELAAFYADTYLKIREQSVVDEYVRATTVVKDRLTAIERDLAGLANDPASVRQRDTLSGQKTVLTQRLDDLSLAGDLSSQGTARVISRAVADRRAVSPKRARDAAMALGAGLALGLGLAYSLELFGGRRSRMDVQDLLNGAAILGELPAANGAVDLAVVRTPHSLFSERIFRLRTAVQFVASPGDHVVVQICSALPGEGRTTVASNLAYALASAGKRVALIDADLRNPHLSGMLNLGGDRPGLREALVGAGEPRLALYADPSLPRLSVLPAGKAPGASADLLSSPRMAEVVGLLAVSHDVVLLDTSPLLPVSDGADVARFARHVVLVVGRKTADSQLERVRDLIATLSLPLLGLVLNNRRAGVLGRYGAREENYSYAYHADADRSELTIYTPAFASSQHGQPSVGDRAGLSPVPAGTRNEQPSHQQSVIFKGPVIYEAIPDSAARVDSAPSGLADAARRGRNESSKRRNGRPMVPDRQQLTELSDELVPDSPDEFGTTTSSKNYATKRKRSSPRPIQPTKSPSPTGKPKRSDPNIEQCHPSYTRSYAAQPETPGTG